MSLINQMLMELDARRSDANGASPFGLQVRSVPVRRKVHAAWWVALALACLLIVVLGWVMLRPPTIVVSSPVQAQLPLRFETDIDSARLATPESQSVQPKPVTMRAVPLAPIMEVPVTVEEVLVSKDVAAAPPAATSTLMAPVGPVSGVTAGAPAGPSATSPDLRGSVPAKPALPKPVTEQLTSTPKAIEPLPPKPDLTDSAPSVVAKQVKELTTQQRAENEFRKATVSIQQGRQSEAIAALEQALQLDAKHVSARQVLIGVLLDTKRMDEAMRIASEGVDLDPGQSGLAMVLARLQIEKNALRPAIETLERSRPYATERADYMAFLAALLQRDAQHGRAAEAYMLALQKTPQNGVWWMGLGISLQAEQRIAEAREAFSRARSDDSLAPDLRAFVSARLAQLPR